MTSFRIFVAMMGTAVLGCHAGAHTQSAAQVAAPAPPVPATQADLAAADQACDVATPYACAVLGVRHELDHQLPVDDPVARRFFTRACERGEPHGCLWLAEDRFVVAGGNPEAAGTAEAARAAQEGCQFGSAPACDLAGRLALAIHDESTALRWEDEACRLGMAASCRYLIRHDVDPPDTPVDVARLYAEACRDHVTSACDQAATAKPTAKKAPSANATPRAPAHTLAASRIAGGEVIAPDSAIQGQLTKIGARQLTAVFELCLDDRGQVATVEVRKPTGAIAYDRKLSRALFGWRYKPYVVDGKPSAVCTELALSYPPSRP